MLLRELIIQLQDLQEDGHGDKEVRVAGCDCVNVATGAKLVTDPKIDYPSYGNLSGTILISSDPSENV